MKLRNIKGTSENDCSCGSWIAHWEKFSGEKAPSTCPAIGCKNTGTEGAHVRKGGGSTDQDWYIYPLCRSHNKKTDQELEVSDAYQLVSANKAKTCDKKPSKLAELLKELLDK